MPKNQKRVGENFNYIFIMTYNDLSKGMVVRLTSGGPQMTVEDFPPDTGWNNVDVDCVWFQDGVIKRATFDSSLLQEV